MLVGLGLLVSLPFVFTYSGNLVGASLKAPLIYFCLFLYWGIVSSVFSEDIGLSLIYSLGYLALTIYALVLARILVMEVSIEALISIFQFALALNILLPLLAQVLDLFNPYVSQPGSGIERLSGFYGQPNPMGAASALFILIFLGSLRWSLLSLFPLRGKTILTIFYLVTFCASIWSLWQSSSRSAFLALLVTLIALLFILGVKQIVNFRRGKLAALASVSLFSTLLLLAPAILIFSDTIDAQSRAPGREYLSALSRTGDPSEIMTMNGRAQLWSYALQKVSERPWVGYGMGSTPSILAARSFGGEVAWSTRAHSAVIEAAVYTGYLGAALFVLFIVSTITRSTFFFLRGDKSLKYPFRLLVFYGVLSLVEPVILGSTRSSLLIVLIIGSYLSLKKATRESTISIRT